MLRHEPPDKDAAARKTGGLIGYVAIWALAGIAVAVVAILATHDAERRQAPRTPVMLPPVREIALARAVSAAQCDIHASRRGGAAGVAVPRPGISAVPISRDQRDAAVHRGMVVIEYRSDVKNGSLDRLAAVQHVVPNGTVLAPSGALRSNQVAVSAYGRQLRCPAVSRPALDAVRLFRGRYLGRMPPDRAG